MVAEWYNQTELTQNEFNKWNDHLRSNYPYFHSFLEERSSVETTIRQMHKIREEHGKTVLRVATESCEGILHHQNDPVNKDAGPRALWETLEEAGEKAQVTGLKEWHAIRDILLTGFNLKAKEKPDCELGDEQER